MPESDLNSASRGIAYVTLLLVSLAALAAIILAMSIAAGMGSQIRKMMHSAERAAKGDLTVTTDSHRKDELGILARSIAKMTNEMKQLIGQASGLTRKVVGSVVLVSVTTGRISHISNEISNVVRQIADGANSQASDTETATTKIGELAVRINNVSKSTEKIEALSAESLKLSDNGLQSMKNLDSRTKKTTEITGAVIEDIHVLNDYSKNIKLQNQALADTISAFVRLSDLMSVFAGEAVDIKTKTFEMQQHKDDVIKTIHEISSISQEIAASTQEVAASIDDQTQLIGQLSADVGELDEASKNLSDSVNRFKL